MDEAVIGDKEGRLPLYLRIAEEIEGGILRQDYQAGTRLPTERELAANMEVNRHTAAQALNYLQSKGLIVRVRGSGTFASPPRIDYRVAEKASFSESVARSGLTPGHKILGVHRIRSYGRLTEELRVPVGEPLVALQRIRFANEIPLNYSRKHFRESLFPGFHEQLYRGGGSIRSLIRAVYGLELFRAHTTFEIEPADEQIAGHLGTPLAAALLKVERLDVLEDGTPAEWGVTYFRGDSTKIGISTHKVKGEDD